MVGVILMGALFVGLLARAVLAAISPDVDDRPPWPLAVAPPRVPPPGWVYNAELDQFVDPATGRRKSCDSD